MAFVAAICGPGCDTHTKLAELDEPEAEIVHVKTRTVGGSGNHFFCSPKIIRSEHAEIHVGDKTTRLPGKWDKTSAVELVADDKATRLAYQKENGWRPVWIGERELLVGSQSHVQSGALDWAKVPNLIDAAPTIYQQVPVQRGAVVNEIEARGADEVAKLLIATADASVQRRADPWDKAFYKLEETARNKVVAALRNAFVNDAPGTALAYRFALHATIRSDAEHDAALAVLATIGPREDPSETVSQSVIVDRTYVALVAQSAQHAAEPTAKWACQQLPELETASMQSVLLLALAAGAHPCDAATPLIAEVPPCHLEWRCGDDKADMQTPLCDADTIGADLDKLLERLSTPTDKSIQHSGPALVRAKRARVAAAVRGGQIPQEVALANARRRYAHTMSGSPCAIADGAGDRCSCDPILLRQAACKARGTSATIANCAFTIDDAAAQITKVQARHSGRVRSIAGGGTTSCAVTWDGGIACWGKNIKRDGEAGTLKRRIPLGGFPQSAKVVSSSRGPCALAEDGAVWCAKDWTDEAPRKVLDGVTDIAAGSLHSCAVRKDGTVSCWGSTNMGQIPGLPVDSKQHPPTPIDGISAVHAISARGFRTCAAHGNQLTCWGGGRGSEKGTLAPHTRDAGSRITHLSGTNLHTCVTTEAKQLRCYGSRQDDAGTTVQLSDSATALAVASWGVAVLVDGTVQWHALKPQLDSKPPQRIEVNDPQDLAAVQTSTGSSLNNVLVLHGDGSLSTLQQAAASAHSR